jgi:hypothetical protein
MDQAHGKVKWWWVSIGLGFCLALAGCQGNGAGPSGIPTATAPRPAAVSDEATAGIAAARTGGTLALAQTVTAADQSPATPILAPTDVPTDAPTSTPAPTATALPTATATPTPTPVPAPRRLTDDGCCWDPFFLDDQVTFIDRPSKNVPAGFYAVPLTGGPEKLVEQRLGYFLNGGAYFSYQDTGQTVIERRKDGKRWQLNTQSQPVTLSPDGSEAAWSLRDWNGPYDQRRAQIWRAPLEGGKPAAVLNLYGGGLSAWLPGDRWLLTGRRAISETDRTLFVYDLKTGGRQNLFQAQNFRSMSVSPDGARVVLQIALDPKAERNGTWLISTAGGQPRKLDWYGAFAWRDAEHIYYFPFQASAAAQELWEYDVASNSSRRLIDPAVTPFKVAQGDFVFEPGGKTLVYVSALDQNLWALDLGF